MRFPNAGFDGMCFFLKREPSDILIFADVVLRNVSLRNELDEHFDQSLNALSLR